MLPEKSQIFRPGQPRVKGDFLRRKPNHLSNGARLLASAVTEQSRIAPRGPALRSEHRNRGRLACAVGAEQTENFALADLEAQALPAVVAP